MKRIYLVTVDNKVSQLAYATLEEAQEFVKTRLDDTSVLDKMQPYYRVIGRDFQMYTIIDVMVEI